MMREIEVNFLPEIYKKKIGKKNKKLGLEKLCKLLCVLLVAFGGGQVVVLALQKGRLQNLNRELQINLATVNARESLKEKIALIDQELSVQKSLPQKIDIQYVLDAIASSQPLSIGLTSLEISHEQRRQPSKNKNAKPIYDVRIMLVGSSPNSDSVKEYVSELESKTVFSNVLVKTVKAMEWKEIEGYTFSVELWIDSDCEYLIPGKGKELYEIQK